MFALLVLPAVCLIAAEGALQERVCQPIRIETCKGIGYNVTSMPNLVGHDLQQDAELQLQTFKPLIEYGCSSRLRFFLCSAYFPMCTDKVPIPIGPCRALCEDIRNRCQPVLQEFGFPWPPGLNCSKFPPQNNDKHMCMEGPADQKGSEANPRLRNRNRRPNHKNLNDVLGERKTFNRAYSQHYGMCKSFRLSEQYFYINRTRRCAPLCSANINFSNDNKIFADYWLAAWSVLCLVCTVFNVFIVIVGEFRMKYPEGVIVFISGCYNACAIAYAIRLLAGRYESSCHMDSQHGAAILIQEGLDNVNCTIIFVILYYFKMSTDGWWVILCFVKYLSNRLRWKSERLVKHSTYYHLFAWGVPCGMTITALVTRVIDADELVGNCYVGNQSTENLLYYVIVPSAAMLGLGLLVLLLSIPGKKAPREAYSQVQQPGTLPRRQEHSKNTSSLIGLYTYLYIIPAVSILAADVYEYLNRDNWVSADSRSRPLVEVFCMKFFMLQIMGVGTSYIIWSSEAMRVACKKFSRSILRRKAPVPAYLQDHARMLPVVPPSTPKRSLSSKANSETIL